LTRRTGEATTVSCDPWGEKWFTHIIDIIFGGHIVSRRHHGNIRIVLERLADAINSLDDGLDIAVRMKVRHGGHLHVEIGGNAQDTA
jgi:hypothetical protein